MRTMHATLTVATLALLSACGPGDIEPSSKSTEPSNRDPVAQVKAPDGATKANDDRPTLDGQFEIAGTQWGETWTLLRFDEAALSMEQEATIRVAGRGTPAVDRAIEALTGINVETTSPDGKRLIDACAEGCTLDAVIAEQTPGEWTVRTLRNVSAKTAPASLDVAREDPRRKLLLDALRPEIERDLGQKVQFEVATLRERDGSAFAVVHPRTPAGKPVDFLKTRHAQRQRDGVLDGETIYALLQHRDGRWQVREYAVGPTDVAWAGWAEDYSAPAVLFGQSAE